MSSVVVSGQAVLAELAAALRAQGGLLADALVDESAPADTRFGELIQQGPQVVHRAAEYALVVEAIREGYLLHYSSGRLLQPTDPDLALLAGDRLYAFGIERLAELEDPYAVARLAVLIGQCAHVHAADQGERAEHLWDVEIRAIGWNAR